MKNKYSIGAIMLVIFSHLFCCIIPLLLLLFNLIFGTSLIFEFTLFSHNLADIILYISGAFIVFSFIMQKLTKNNDRKDKITLYISAVIYVLIVLIDLVKHYYFE